MRIRPGRQCGTTCFGQPQGDEGAANAAANSKTILITRPSLGILHRSKDNSQMFMDILTRYEWACNRVITNYAVDHNDISEDTTRQLGVLKLTFPDDVEILKNIFSPKSTCSQIEERIVSFPSVEKVPCGENRLRVEWLNAIVWRVAVLESKPRRVHKESESELTAKNLLIASFAEMNFDSDDNI